MPSEAWRWEETGRISGPRRPPISKTTNATAQTPGPTLSARTRSSAQGFGYTVMNLGLGFGVDYPHRDHARVSAVRRYERATELEFLTKRGVRLAGHRIIPRVVQQCAFELCPIPRRETEGNKEFCLGCSCGMNGIQQVLGNLPIVQDRVCDPWQLAHSG